MLTAADRADLDAAADDMMRCALSTERCDRVWAEGAVRTAYTEAKLRQPRHVIWLDSPLAGAYLASVLHDDPVHERLRSGMRYAIERSVAERLGDDEAEALRDEIWTLTNERLWSQLWRELRGRQWFRLKEQLRVHPLDRDGNPWAWVLDELPVLSGQPVNHMPDPLRDDISLWRDGFDLLRLRFSLRFAGLRESTRLNTVTEACDHVGWWWAFREVAILTDRPLALERDKQGRPHCADGPAMFYADGFALHYWHGTHVPAWVIESPTLDAILTEPNAEVRRSAIEHYGWDRFTADAGMVKVAECPDPGNAPHLLSLWELPTGMADMYAQPARILLCTNGTPDRSGELLRYGLTVPAYHDDPVAAAADLYDMPVAAYRDLEIRT